MYKFIEIDTIDIIKNDDGIIVNDLSIQTDESYIANNYIVHNCITSSNSANHYPMASLIDDCKGLKNSYNLTCKIIADGGISNFSRAIKALA